LFEAADIPVYVQAEMLHYLWVQYAITGGLWPALVRAGALNNYWGIQILSNQFQSGE